MFWKFNLITTSHIDTLLNKENVTLKELMDEDDLLQECKAQNKKLIDFLTHPEVMDEMVTLITQEPDEDIEEKLRYKYPNIACELLTSDVGQINDSLANDEALLNKLYGFLDTEKPLNPLLTSFFSKTWGLLISRKTEVIFDFLKSKDDFISLLLNHIETSAIMDLLLRLITCIENNDLRYAMVKWLSEQKVIERLVALIDSSYNEDCNVNAAQALCDIVKVNREHMSLLQEKADPDPLLEDIESTELVNLLLNHMFSDEKRESVLVSGISVLLSLLEFKKQGPAGQQQIPQNQVQQPNFQNESAPHCFASLFYRSDGPEQMTSLDAERLARGVNSVLAAVTPRLGDFHQLLLEPPVKPPITTTVEVLESPLGYTRLEVGHLLTALLATNTHGVNLQLTGLGTISVLMDLFFKYTWNNFLHTQVEQALGRIITNSPTIDEEENKVHPLLDQVLSQYRLVQRILDAWDENEQEQSLPGKHRRGYMGHLTKIANHIAQNADNGSNSTLINEKLKELPEEYSKRWESFVSDVLTEINKKNQTPLGGGIPIPSSSESEECVDFRDIPFSQESALQQAFSDYQMQRMNSTFDDQFGFNDDDFVDTDDNITGQLSRLAHVNFQFNDEENIRNAELFEQVCHERVPNLGYGDSDEEVWDDKENEAPFSSRQAAQQRSSDENSSDSDEESQPPTELSASLPATSDEIKMEIDHQDPWTTTLDSVPMDVAPVTISNPWENSESQKNNEDQGNWADFSNFAEFSSSDKSRSDDTITTTTTTATATSIPTTTTSAMETSDASSTIKFGAFADVFSVSDSKTSERLCNSDSLSTSRQTSQSPNIIDKSKSCTSQIMSSKLYISDIKHCDMQKRDNKDDSNFRHSEAVNVEEINIGAVALSQSDEDIKENRNLQTEGDTQVSTEKKHKEGVLNGPV